MPAPTKAKKSQAFPALDGMFLLTPDQHRTVAKDLRRQVNDPKAQELATAHEKIQKHLDEQTSASARAAIEAECYAAQPEGTHVDRC